MNEIAHLYSQSQAGGELPYFIGKQYGTGWLRNIARFAFPILKRIGRAALNTASDVIYKKQQVLPALKSNAVQLANSFISTPQPSSSINKRKKRKTSTIFK